MDREKRKQTIDDMCDQAGCGERVRKIHFGQFVDHSWHPHPPNDFVSWWPRHRDYSYGVDAKRAYNCQIYRNEFLESKQYGLPVS